MLTTDNVDEETELQIQIWGFLPPKLEILWQNHQMQNRER